MTILFVGSELGDFTADLGNLGSSTGNYDSEFSRVSVFIDENARATTASQPFAPQSDLWVHWLGWYGSYTFNNAMIEFVAGTVPVFQMTPVAFRHWDGSGWVDIPFAALTGQFNYDIHFVAEASGLIQLYRNEALVAEFTGDFSAATGTTFIRFRGVTGNTGSSARISQVIAADQETLGWRVATNPPTANGAVAEWTGTFAEIDETNVVTTDVIVADAVGETMLLAKAARAIPVQFDVAAIVVSAYARQADASVPQDVQAVMRVGGVNYFSADLGIGSGFEPRNAMFTTNPATGLSWTRSVAGDVATQFGFRAVA